MTRWGDPTAFILAEAPLALREARRPRSAARDFAGQAPHGPAGRRPPVARGVGGLGKRACLDIRDWPGAGIQGWPWRRPLSSSSALNDPAFAEEPSRSRLPTTVWIGVGSGDGRGDGTIVGTARAPPWSAPASDQRRVT